MESLLDPARLSGSLLFWLSSLWIFFMRSGLLDPSLQFVHSILYAARYTAVLFVVAGLAADCIAQNKYISTTAPERLELPGESFTIHDRPAFIYLPEQSKRSTPQPWIFYAPTLPAYPDQAERWMHEQFLAAGIAVAGVDVGEAYGSPLSHPIFNAFYEELTAKRGFATKPCLFGRSRGGLWVSSWAIAHPDRVAGIIGIYPVYDFRTYPKIENAAPAYGVSPEKLTERNAQWNPIERIEVLAKAKIPITIIHGDEDVVVPLKENSQELLRRYERVGEGALVNLIVVKGQGHNFWEGFFKEQRLVDFAIQQARAGAK